MLIRPSHHSFFLFFLHFLLSSLIPVAYAAPSGIRRYETTSFRRQNPKQKVSRQVTVTTVQHTITPLGPATETCKITLTPITEDGQPEVKEVKQCSFSLDSGSSGGGGDGDGGGDSGNGTSNGIGTSTESSGGTTTSTSSTASAASSSPIILSSADPSGTQTSSSPSGTDSGTTTTTSSATTSSGSANTNPAVKVNGVSTVPAATASFASSPPPPSTVATSSTPNSSSTSLPTVGTSAADSAAASSAAASSASAAAANASSEGAFTLPGKKLSVLPIGLGVFAGISVIALIVVGLVTYERTKYRKAFRQRKLAEAGQEMGYGGMVGRV